MNAISQITIMALTCLWCHTSDNLYSLSLSMMPYFRQPLWSVPAYNAILQTSFMVCHCLWGHTSDKLYSLSLPMMPYFRQPLWSVTAFDALIVIGLELFIGFFPKCAKPKNLRVLWQLEKIVIRFLQLRYLNMYTVLYCPPNGTRGTNMGAAIVIGTYSSSPEGTTLSRQNLQRFSNFHLTISYK